MKALELLKKIKDGNFQPDLYNRQIDEVITELEDINKLIESFDKKMPKGDIVFEIEIVDNLNLKRD